MSGPTNSNRDDESKLKKKEEIVGIVEAIKGRVCHDWLLYSNQGRVDMIQYRILTTILVNII